MSLDGKHLTFNIEYLAASKLSDGLDDFFERYKEVGNFLIATNNRWLAVKKLGDYFYCFNCHSTAADGSWDVTYTEPAAVFRAATIQEATEVIQLFGCYNEGPHAVFAGHSVEMKEIV